jgi:predicted enzyme related to lactoylglutathione lyase
LPGESTIEIRRLGMGDPVVHFEVAGQDMATLTAFYRDAFDWQIQDVMDGVYYMADTGSDGDLAGGIGVDPTGGKGHVMFYIQVADPAAALEKIKSLGGSIVNEPMDVPGGPTLAQFADPEGHVIGLVKGP